MPTEIVDIEEALAVFLRTPIELADAERNYHLRIVQQQVGDQIWNARQPQTAAGPVAILVLESYSNNVYDLLNEDQLAQTYLEIQVWGKNPRQVRRVKGSLHIVLTNYKSTTGTKWNGVDIDGCTITTGWRTGTNRGVQGNDDWAFNSQSIWLVSHCQTIPADGAVALSG